MEKLLLQAVIVTTFMINFSLSARRFGIMYGEETDIQKFPYQVVYRANGTFRCGGSIINGDCIVTAGRWAINDRTNSLIFIESTSITAHCVVGYPKNISVRAGSSLRSSGGVVIPVKQAINHPEYDQKTLLNDVAVLKLSESFEFNDVIQPIALNCDEVSDDTECIVSGWGRTESGKSSETLRSVTLHTINKETCQINYNDKRVKYRLPSSSLCAGVSQVDLKGQNQTKDSCSGDSVSLRPIIDLFSSLNFLIILRVDHL